MIIHRETNSLLMEKLQESYLPMNLSLKVITRVLVFFVSYPLFACSLCTFFGFEQPICQLDKELQYIITKNLLEQTPEILYPLTVRHPICTLSSHDDYVKSVHFVNNSTLLSNSDDKLCVWNIQQETITDTTKPLIGYPIAAGKYSTIAISPDNKMIATRPFSSRNAIQLWDLASIITCNEPILLGTLEGHTRDISSFKFSADPNYLISSSFDQTVRLWDLTTTKPVLTLKLPQGFCRMDAACISGNLEKIITISMDLADNSLCIWEKENNFLQPQVIRFPHVDTDQENRFLLRGAYFINNDSQILIIGADQHSRCIYDLTTKQLSSLDTRQKKSWHAKGCYQIFYDEQNNVLINSSADCTASLCDGERHNVRIIFSKHEDAVVHSHLNADYTLIATGSADKTIKLWHIPDFSDLTIKQALFLRFMHDVTCASSSNILPEINGNVAMINFSDDGDLKTDLQDAFGCFTYVQQQLLINRFFKELYKLNVFLNLDTEKQLKEQAASVL